MSFEPDGYLLTARDGPQLWFAGTRMNVKAGGAPKPAARSPSSNGPRHHVGPPLHVHGREDEAFYIIDGQISVECGAKRFTAGPGDFTFLPRGIPHTFLVTRGPVRGLQITAQGRIRGVHIAEAGSPAQRPGPCPSAGRTRHRAPGRRRAAPRQPDPRPAAGPAVTVTRHRAGGADIRCISPNIRLSCGWDAGRGAGTDLRLSASLRAGLGAEVVEEGCDVRG